LAAFSTQTAEDGLIQSSEITLLSAAYRDALST
jgi:hypothetical protein